MEKPKVFGIGFQKTGTTSLESALEALGYRVYGGDKNLMKYDDTQELKSYIAETLTQWDAVQDMPWPLFYKELYELFPDAKFILTKRESNAWIKSVVRHFGMVRIPLHQKIYDVPKAEGYEDVYVKTYEAHNEAVISFFKEKDNFLVMEIGKNFNYKVLCDFIGIPKPEADAFPHSRKNKQKYNKYKWYRYLRAIYVNYKKGY
ncbi:sulfotransferase [Rasiella rasia]|uniref:Sulfotransferase n=1 Tax=Rasiella rasia TaxID=2744027 RepID=A0A6G6GQC3_9FLAO|nr:sulfotransferase family protein [Rasiella rasia]QIE60633.1 sulfotransferase [Rasiella rasia]